ncbi:MAG: Cob(I)yrinic acid a,c-diamide adenosyltransferase [Microgenomates bacterium 39_7]|nr:MAG: Cob(I)yrinic acid a,c-diamide adenosyltransferase [Microgenomates bacterium 39_7]
MTSITTKTGDNGESSLANGTRLSKSDLIFDVIGDLDELSSWIGWLISALEERNEYLQYRVFLNEIQRIIYLISAEIVCARKEGDSTLLQDDSLQAIEKNCLQLEKEVKDSIHSKFVHPGGCVLSAQVDITRSVCRRAERSLVRLAQKSEVRLLLLSVCNRLSDYLYLLRCFINQQEGVVEQTLSVAVEK